MQNREKSRAFKGKKRKLSDTFLRKCEVIEVKREIKAVC